MERTFGYFERDEFGLVGPVLFVFLRLRRNERDLSLGRPHEAPLQTLWSGVNKGLSLSLSLSI